ncbi:MAG: sensor histidine kinase [Alloprevotella sp.]
MKKSTIWLIAVIMGTSLLTLIYLQTSYMQEVLEMRKEQFDSSVSRSLFLTARKMELEETQHELEIELNTSEPALQTLSDMDTLQSDEFARYADSISRAGRPGGFIGNAFAGRPKPSDEFRKKLRERYIHQKNLVNEVVYSLLYETSGKPLSERIDFDKMDRSIRNHLNYSGINLKYHVRVCTADGREVFRCPEYEPEGEEHSYQQVVFANDPSNRIGIIYIHFPEIRKYLYAGVKFLIPAIIFTIVVLIVFIFTIYTIFRQKRLTEIKNDFINNMTHEFKTPISSISLAAQMLSDPGIVRNETMLKHITSVISDETKRLRFQVDKVLQMSMFEKKTDTFKRKELDLHDLIQDVVQTYRLKVENQGGSIRVDLRATETNVFVDEMHFTNVLFNLMDNAMKYRKEEEPLHLDVSTRSNGNKVTIAIKDNGIGIRKEDLKKIFEKFYRVHTGNRHDVKGFGLGLAYVKNVIDYHRGHIHAESEPGRGTTFVITIPTMGKS